MWINICVERYKTNKRKKKIKSREEKHENIENQEEKRVKSEKDPCKCRKMLTIHYISTSIIRTSIIFSVK